MRISEQCAVALKTAPVDTTGAAIATGTIDMKYVKDLTIFIITGAIASGASAQAVTLVQSTDSSKTSAKALAFAQYYLGTTSDDTLAATTVTSNTFNLAANSVCAIEIDASQLDVTNGFDHIHVAISTPGANASLVAIMAVGSTQRYSAITTLG